MKGFKCPPKMASSGNFSRFAEGGLSNKMGPPDGHPVQKARGGKIPSARTTHVPYGRSIKSSPPVLPAAMALPKPAGAKAPPSLARIAASGNPAMMMKKGGKTKVEKVMHEFKTGALHSGSKKGPVVKNRKQAIAIALSEAKKAKKG